MPPLFFDLKGNHNMKKYGYTETRQISSYDLRGICIRENWFTAGDNEEYAELLNTADALENVTTDDLVELASMICEHTAGASVQDDEFFCNVLFILANDACQSSFDIDR